MGFCTRNACGPRPFPQIPWGLERRPFDEGGGHVGTCWRRCPNSSKLGGGGFGFIKGSAGRCSQKSDPKPRKSHTFHHELSDSGSAACLAGLLRHTKYLCKTGRGLGGGRFASLLTAQNLLHEMHTLETL